MTIILMISILMTMPTNKPNNTQSVGENSRRIRIVLEYDGTDYIGWQRQSNGLSVQEVVERELKKITGEDITLHASGRTDAGVHAAAQVAHFNTFSRIPADKFPYAVNVVLPKDIRVVYGDCPANQNFHARFDVRKKHYRYEVLNAPHASVFCRNTSLHIHAKMDYDLLNYSAKQVLGEHDFAAFKAQGTRLATTVRTIYESNWSVNGNLLTYDICGNGFMYNMVRILVGTMISIAKGQCDKDSISHALETKARIDAGATAPACGLTLARVEYEDFDTAQYISHF